MFVLHHLLLSFVSSVDQVQEKKVKKVSTMNVDPSKSAGNGSNASSSNSSSSGTYLANGGSPDRCLNNDLSFPVRGVQSLRLPVVGPHPLLLMIIHIAVSFMPFTVVLFILIVSVDICSLLVTCS